MSYSALYRKYRPKTFAQVIGQDHITTTLKNQILTDKISHAYLFCGARGTGKTSVAKIFARAINCPNNKAGEPCNKCNICTDENNLDIMEIDAASNNGVEYIRDLRENVKYPPINSKYKVYIIDEVHMLSESAFNALLKTLEEPPKYVVFILATTEIQKLPATILSRCMRFDFKLVSVKNLEKLLEKIFKDSGYTYEKEALTQLAILGDGSVRDMLSIADMCVAYTNGNVTYNSVLETTGATDKIVLTEIAQSILNNDVRNVLEKIEKISSQGKSITQLNKDLLYYFKDLAIIKTCDGFKSIINYPENILKEMITLVKDVPQEKLVSVLQKLSGLDQDFRYTNNPKALFEVVILGLFD